MPSTPRSISPASRTSTGRELHPERRRHRLDGGKLADPAARCRIAKDRRSRHARRDLLEQFQPFAAQAVFELDETGGVAARPRQALDQAGADRVGDIANTIGTVRVACSNGRRSTLPAARMTSGASATNSAAYLRMRSASPRPTIVDPHVAADRSSPDRCSPARNAGRGPGLRIVRGEGMSTPMRRIALGCCARAASGHAAAAPPSSVMNSRRRSFDHLVGADEQRRWNVDAERLCGLEVDEQLDFGGLLHREIGGLLAPQYPATVSPGHSVGLREAAAVAEQTAS